MWRVNEWIWASANRLRIPQLIRMPLAFREFCPTRFYWGEIFFPHSSGEFGTFDKGPRFHVNSPPSLFVVMWRVDKWIYAANVCRCIEGFAERLSMTGIFPPSPMLRRTIKFCEKKKLPHLCRISPKMHGSSAEIRVAFGWNCLNFSVNDRFHCGRMQATPIPLSHCRSIRYEAFDLISEQISITFTPFA